MVRFFPFPCARCEQPMERDDYDANLDCCRSCAAKSEAQKRYDIEEPGR